MIKFNGNILQLGFGAVGKSFYEIVKNEIGFDNNRYFVIAATTDTIDFYLENGGIKENFSGEGLTKKDYKARLGSILKEGDLLIDFSSQTGSSNIINWCAENNVMYINTGDNDWPDEVWNGSFFDNSINVVKMQQDFANNPNINKHPIVIQHGNNPGIVSHYAKMGLRYIVETQFKDDKNLNDLAARGAYNLLARELGVKMVQISDKDEQQANIPFSPDVLYNTWCPESFYWECVMKAEFTIGSHEDIKGLDATEETDTEAGYIQLSKMGMEYNGLSYCPSGEFRGRLIPHEETFSISRLLEVWEDGKLVYRPTCLFVYQACDIAEQFMQNINEGDPLPTNSQVMYYDKVTHGAEYVGTFLLGDKFDPVWLGNGVCDKLIAEMGYSSWQMPTVLPVAASALGALCWMLQNQNKKGLFFPEDINEFDYIVGIAEKYIAPTIYQTFTKAELDKINFENLQVKDFITPARSSVTHLKVPAIKQAVK